MFVRGGPGQVELLLVQPLDVEPVGRVVSGPERSNGRPSGLVHDPEGAALRDVHALDEPGRRARAGGQYVAGVDARPDRAAHGLRGVRLAFVLSFWIGAGGQGRGAADRQQRGRLRWRLLLG